MPAATLAWGRSIYSHLTIGTAHIPRAARFYDNVLKPLGMVRRKTSTNAIGYVPESFEGINEPFWVVRPYDNNAASPGNGVTVASGAPSRVAVAAFHAAAPTRARRHYACTTIRIISAPMCGISTATRYAPSATIQWRRVDRPQRVQTMATKSSHLGPLQPPEPPVGIAPVMSSRSTLL